MLRLLFFCIAILGSDYYYHDQTLYSLSQDPIVDVLDWQVIDDNLWTIEGEINQVDGITYGQWIRYYERGELIYENSFEAVKPWNLQVGDLDGDGQYELIIGTYNKAPYYEIAKRPFVFNWNGDILSKRWTGSSLSFFELDDFLIDDIDKDGIDEIITQEIDFEGQLVSYVYRWVDFGFTQEENTLEIFK